MTCEVHTIPQLQCIALAAAFFVAAAPSSANFPPLGTIVEAERAHVGAAVASAGSTVFDGDRLSTEDGGFLRIAGPALAMQLDAHSLVFLRNPPNAEHLLTVELSSGTVVLAAAATGNLAIRANDALIRPAASQATVAHIRVVTRRELRIYAQRGTLEFSYHGQSRTMAEGGSYRILLDPSESEVASDSEADPNNKKSGIGRPTFLLVAIGIAAAIAIPVLLHNLESPDRP